MNASQEVAELFTQGGADAYIGEMADMRQFGRVGGVIGCAIDSPLCNAGDEPLAIMQNYLRTDSGVTAEGLAERGLYRLLRAAGTDIRIADQVIGARKASAAEAELLGESRGATLLTLERTAYDDAGRPVELGRHVYRADRYSFEMTVMARG